MSKQQSEREKRRERRREALETESLRYGIDLSEIDREELARGENDIYAVYLADLDDGREPAPLIVGLMYGIQQKYGEPVGV
jgi:ethanolamine utilization protein EutQ (cupin superfamily)